MIVIRVLLHVSYISFLHVPKGVPAAAAAANTSPSLRGSTSGGPVLLGPDRLPEPVLVQMVCSYDSKRFVSNVLKKISNGGFETFQRKHVCQFVLRVLCFHPFRCCFYSVTYLSH